MPRHYAIYGNVSMLRDKCPKCRRMSLIIQGNFACCGWSASHVDAKYLRRMSEPSAKKLKPSKEEQRSILKEQNNLCLYCDRQFGMRPFDGAAPLRVEWDHMVPFAYSQNNSAQNFAAACHICNSIKSDLVFESIEKVRVYVHDKIETARRKRVAGVRRVHEAIQASSSMAEVLQEDVPHEELGETSS